MGLNHFYAITISRAISKHFESLQIERIESQEASFLFKAVLSVEKQLA